MSNSARHLYEFGPFRLDPSERLLLRDGQAVQLTPKTFDTLVALVERSGRLVEKEELMRAVWPDSFVEEGNLCVTISMLRKALGSGHDENKYIETVSKRGYRFAVSVKEVPSEEQSDLSAQMEVVSEQRDITSHNYEAAVRQTERAGPSWKPRPVWITASLVLGGIALTFLILWVATKKEASATGDAATLGIRSVAVLPFKALGGNSGDENLGLGMADTLITKLGNIGQIVVRPTSAVSKYASSSHDAQSAGSEQGVDAVLSGHIQREGDRVRVNVQLVRVSDGAQLWAHPYYEKYTDIFAVQDAISEKVAQAIRLKLTGEEKKLLAKRFTGNTEAYQDYVRGRYFWNKRTEEGLNKGIGYFRQAIEKDPTYAQAQAGLADSYAMLCIYTVLPPNEGYPKAKLAAMQALELDEGLAEAHASLGVISFYYDWDGPAAENHFQRVFEINPNYAIAHMWYGMSLSAMGRLAEAGKEMKRAQEIDPLSLIINTNVGWILYLEGKYDEAIHTYEKTIEIDPDFARAHFRLGMAYEQKGMYERAIEEFQKASILSGGDPHYELYMGHAQAMSGKKGQARKVLTEMKKRSERQYIPSYGIALIYLGLGEKNEAFKWLEKALEDRSYAMIFLKVDPMLSSLRSDSKFIELTQHIGF